MSTGFDIDRGLLYPDSSYVRLFPFSLSQDMVQIHDQIITDFLDSSFATNYHLHTIEKSFFLKLHLNTYLQNLYKYLYLDLPFV